MSANLQKLRGRHTAYPIAALCTVCRFTCFLHPFHPLYLPTLQYSTATCMHVHSKHGSHAATLGRLAQRTMEIQFEHCVQFCKSRSLTIAGSHGLRSRIDNHEPPRPAVPMQQHLRDQGLS